MITISKKNPWILWPDSICQNFIKKSALSCFDNNRYYKIEIEFSYSNYPNKLRHDIFTILPDYTGIFIEDNRLYITNECIGYAKTYCTEIVLIENKKYKLVLEYMPDERMNLFIENSVEYSINLDDDKIKPKSKSILLLGSSTLISETDDIEEESVCVYEIKIYDIIELITHHNFNNIINNKSIDLTDNFNLFYKTGK
jgi:hypothetical protein